MASKKTKIGIEENLAGVLCYLVGFVSGIVMFAIERDNRFVKFHALQSFVVFLGLTIINMLVGVIPFIGSLLGALILILMIFLWIFLIVKAFGGEKYMVPGVGKFVEETLMKKADSMASGSTEKKKEKKEKKE